VRDAYLIENVRISSGAIGDYALAGKDRRPYVAHYVVRAKKIVGSLALQIG